MGFLFGKVFRFLLVIYVGVFAFLIVRPFPADLKFSPAPVLVDQSAVTFLADVTTTASTTAQRVDESIVPAMLEMIKDSHSFVLADIFLVNEFQGATKVTRRDTTKEFIDALVEKKTKTPTSTVIMIVDPINSGYGGIASADYARMKAAGVDVVEAPLDALPDSNLLWSTVYRMLFMWFGNSSSHGWLPNPLDHDGPKVTLRTYAALLNFKGDHRKLLVTDAMTKNGRVLKTLVGSLNPHTASSENGNVALTIDSAVLANQVVSGENLVLHEAGHAPVSTAVDDKTTVGPLQVTYLTENGIKKSLLTILDSARAGDKIDLAMFYLSERSVVAAIEQAKVRGVTIRILLDQNETAFGHDKYGIPNQQTADRLMGKATSTLAVRWCNTHGEQCHAKMLLATVDGRTSLLLGSANYTRRNLDLFNLESAVLVETSGPAKAITDAHLYFERLWGNTKGETSLPYESHRDATDWKSYLATFMEFSGLSTF